MRYDKNFIYEYDQKPVSELGLISKTEAHHQTKQTFWYITLKFMVYVVNTVRLKKFQTVFAIKIHDYITFHIPME